MNVDLPHRKFRFIEALDERELIASRCDFAIVAGWLELAEQIKPKSPKGIIEGEYLARTADGTFFKELSYKSAHDAVDSALVPWAQSSGRRWAKVESGEFIISDGRRLPLHIIQFIKNQK